MTRLAIINNITNICENVTSDIRPANEINIQGYTVLDLDQTSVIHWNWNETLNDFEEVEDSSDGGIGYAYSNGKLITPKPEKPVVEDQPTTTGIEEI
jgi:hypothetical protein